MSNRRLVFFVAPWLFLFSFLSPSDASQETASCLTCHTAMKGLIKNPAGKTVDLNVDSERFQSSVHGTLSCTDCHIQYSDNPHTAPDASVPAPVASVARKLSAKYGVDPVAAAACLKCHEEIVAKVTSSVHGRNIFEKHQTDGAWCIDCHGPPHYIVKSTDPRAAIGRVRQVETCGRCHGDKALIEKYKLQENVMESFRESFHGRKLLLGHTKVPVCSSCHRGHDILSKNDPNSPVFGRNKLVTCGKCHKGANEKFVPAITHQPPGPIPYYTEKALIILLLSTFTFIVAHVLLEAFSDIRDAIFRKGRKD